MVGSVWFGGSGVRVRHPTYLQTAQGAAALNPNGQGLALKLAHEKIRALAREISALTHERLEVSIYIYIYTHTYIYIYI